MAPPAISAQRPEPLTAGMMQVHTAASCSHLPSLSASHPSSPPTHSEPCSHYCSSIKRCNYLAQLLWGREGRKGTIRLVLENSYREHKMGSQSWHVNNFAWNKAHENCYAKELSTVNPPRHLPISSREAWFLSSCQTLAATSGLILVCEPWTSHL